MVSNATGSSVPAPRAGPGQGPERGGFHGGLRRTPIEFYSKPNDGRERSDVMNVKTRVKAGKLATNHNETLVRLPSKTR